MSDEDIHIVDYDPRWPARFAEEAERVRRLIAAPSLEIEQERLSPEPYSSSERADEVRVDVRDFQVERQRGGPAAELRRGLSG
jgi:hypothetical protein